MPKAPSTTSSFAAQVPQPLKRNQPRRPVISVADANSNATRSDLLAQHVSAPMPMPYLMHLPEPKPSCPPSQNAPLTMVRDPFSALDRVLTGVAVVDPPVLTEMSKTQKLESRIQELESLLLEKDFKSTTSSPPPSMQDNMGNDMDILASALTQSPAFDIPVMATPSDDSPKSATGLEMIWANYPPGIPNVELLRHLVEVFFVFHPHAKRIIHYPSFMAALSLSPNHPKFPIAPVLHAICALGALYTAAVTSPPLPDFSAESPDEIFTHRQRLREGRPDSFAEQQAKYARDTADEIEAVGDRLLEVMQGSWVGISAAHFGLLSAARTILTWFYWSHSRWLEVFISSAHCLRTAVPLGLNVCPPFHSITHSVRLPCLVFFWTLEPPSFSIGRRPFSPRHQQLSTTKRGGTCSGWPIAQNDCTGVATGGRCRWMTRMYHSCSLCAGTTSRKACLSRLIIDSGRRRVMSSSCILRIRLIRKSPPRSFFLLVLIATSFVLWVKGTMIISRAKTFNTRFRSKFHFGDASVMSPHTEPNNPLEPVDPRGSPAFTEIDSIATTFRSTFPAHLRNPISNNVVDQHLYVACLMPLVATIILHDPHAEVRRSGCVSALRIVTAARSILDLAYEVCSTSFDVTLLDPFCSFCWFLAGRVLIRFLQAALDVNNTEQVSTLRAELEFLQSAIMRIGQRVPLALRYGKMLGDLITKRCGPVDPTQTAHTPLTFPRAASVQDDDVDIWFEQPGHSLHESLGMQSVPSYMTVG
ncbi:Eukaryotic translation initiation factor 3 subunit H [Mycena chlorophos]|uniref:Eukaryotic translation initiation factor 3 subunit H n=1 Tax=Mycena chlorophos TaxID=658473 RepID=A0A8H6WFZ3_MYCCL|nr:Eukaryotic translation initiation factor 3 subunit H [Mycena chlorophos]